MGRAPRAYSPPLLDMPEQPLVFSRTRARLAVEILVAAVITAMAGFIYVNGAFFSSISAPWVDFSINFTAAHAFRYGANPYGETTLFERAEAIGTPTALIYRQLFTSYIQPPTSAISVIPLTFLGWPEGGRAYLVLNNLFLFGAIGLTFLTVRPGVPWLWAAVGALLILAAFNQVYTSLALGQVDASIAFLLALGLWAYRSGRLALTGSTIAIGAAIKLLPAILLLYFLWRREHKVVLWGVGVGMAILVASLPIAGFGTYQTYLTETVPALTKGSTYYSNISIVGAITRPYVPGPLGDLDPLFSLEEVPYVAAARVLSMLATLALLGLLAVILGSRMRAREPAADGAGRPAPIAEYYLVVAVALMLSSVTWDFYVVWLLPFFVAAFLAPGSVLPPHAGLRLGAIGLLVLSFIGLNYPGDFLLRNLFDVNSVFYRPDLVPGIWVEDRLRFYSNYLELVPWLRLGSLFLFALTLAGLVLHGRLQEPSSAPQRDPVPSPAVAD
jgi:hypothetical protein